MIVVCPQCSKRYMLDGELIPKQGRQVRCVSCHYTWRQLQLCTPATDTIALKETDTFFDGPVIPRKKSRWMGKLVVFAFFVSLISTFTLGQKFVIKFWPQTERFYHLAGFPPQLQESELTIANANSLLHQKDSLEMVQVGGDIINTSDRVRPIPPLKIKALNKDSHVLDSWEHRLSENSLLPGEQIRFETEPRLKVEGTHHISVEF